MKRSDRFCWIGALVASLGLAGAAGCSPVTKIVSKKPGDVTSPSVPREEESRDESEDAYRRVVILGTNDIHGGIEAKTLKDGTRVGGMPMWSGVAKALRTGIAKKSQGREGVVLVDAGDQFQGTMLSNMSEGVLTIQAMNAVGYDAVIPGNHDYDFGPVGWLDDQVTADTADQDSKGAFRKAIATAKFPFISANTFLRESLVDASGAPVPVDSIGCQPKSRGAAIDWTRAKAPEYLAPYVIREVSGLRVALIGLDNPSTPSTTTPANVTDLCFDDEVAAYLRVRRALDGQADVFVIVAHDGATDPAGGGAHTHGEGEGFRATLEAILAAQGSWKGGIVDAVIAGHTHYMNKFFVNGVPVIQSRSGGEAFGRIDLYWGDKHKSVYRKKTRAWAAVSIYDNRCAPFADFCEKDGKTGELRYEGEIAQADAGLEALIARERAAVAPVAGRKLGIAAARVDKDRVNESALANALTDALRSLSGTDLAFMNTGGIRTSIEAGDITYEDLFNVLPFNNHGVVVAPMSRATLMALLKRSVATCGEYGALMQSGLRVQFTKTCKSSGTVDPQARLQVIDFADGRRYWDAVNGYALDAPTSFRAATLDFLAAGGSGFADFEAVPLVRDDGIVREAIVQHLLLQPAAWTGKTDGRWLQQGVPQTTPVNPALIWGINPSFF